MGPDHFPSGSQIIVFDPSKLYPELQVKDITAPTLVLLVLLAPFAGVPGSPQPTSRRTVNNQIDATADSFYNRHAFGET